MTEESHNPLTDPELEARIVALVLGEASSAERDELNRLIEQRPELAAFKDQILHVHGLMQDVGTRELAAEEDDWKLSAEKRQTVLTAIDGEGAAQNSEQVIDNFAQQGGSAKGSFVWTLTRIAAVFCVVGCIGSVVFFHYRAMDSARAPLRVLHEARDARESSDYLWDAASAPSRKSYFGDDARAAIVADRRSGGSRRAVDASVDYEEHSRSALGVIRDTVEFDVASTEGVNGRATLPQQQADSHGLIASDKASWSGKRDGNADRPMESAAAGRQSGSVDFSLSLPKVAASAGEPTAAGVPEQGRALFGGVKLFADMPSQTGDSAKPNASLPVVPEYAGAETAESQRTAGGTVADREFYDQSGQQGQSQSFGFIAVDELGGSSHESQRPLSDMRDSLAEEDSIEGFAADGENLGGTSFGETEGGYSGGGFGGGSAGYGAGTAGTPSNELKKRMSTERQPPDPGAPLDALSTQNELSTPTLPSLTDVAKLERPLGSKISELSQGVHPRPNLAKKPMAPKGVIDGVRRLAGDRYEEEIAKKSASDGGEDGTFFKRRAPQQDAWHSQPLSEAAASTALGQPREELPAKQVQEDRGWAYPAGRPNVAATTTWRDDAFGLDEQAKESLRDINEQSELKSHTDADEKLLPRDFGNNVEPHWRRPYSGAKAKQEDKFRRNQQLAIEGENRWGTYVPLTLEESRGETSVRKLAAPAGLQEKTAKDDAFSTFSLHVSDVSFKLARSALAQGEWPEAAKVRIEEFVNAFDYGDPLPSPSEKVACCLEQSIHPFLQQRNLMRISMRTSAAGRSSSTPLRLTFLLDNSGSMERPDRQQTVRRAFALLAQQLKPIDQVTLISFARQPRLLADKVNGTQSRQLVQLIDSLPSEGGTNIEAALRLAFEKAQEHQADGAQNRIVLLTDGAVNLGDANPDNLSRMITTMREVGIAFDAAGISAEGFER